MLKNNILLYILYRVCIKSRPSNNINNVRNREKVQSIIIITKIKIKYYNTYKIPIRNYLKVPKLKY